MFILGFIIIKKFPEILLNKRLLKEAVFRFAVVFLVPWG